MSMKFEIRQATRTGVVPLIGLYSESGCGKTYGALLLSRGIAGPDGQIVMIDTETGRGSLYADVIPGGYQVLDLEPPFSPQRYREAITAAVATKPAALIIDSMSHEWEGAGGVLDMAGENEEKSGKPGLHCWKVPKLEHGRLMLDLLRCPVPVVVCVRAKHKSKQQKNPKTGKTEIVKDDYTSPIQSAEFIFEMTAHAELLQDHTVRVTKCSHPDLRKCFPADGKGMIEFSHGEAVAEWCGGGNAAPTKTEPAKPPEHKLANTPVPRTTTKSEKAQVKDQLWAALNHVHGGKSRREATKDDVIAINEYLYDNGVLNPAGEELANLTVQRMEEVIEELKAVAE